MRALCALNTAFYEAQSASFSASRHNAWYGWHRVLEIAQHRGVFDGEHPRVLDAACGNMRFFAYMAQELPIYTPAFYGIDNCTGLACGADSQLPSSSTVSYQQFDLVGALVNQSPLAEALDAPACDLVCSFGFLHHIPSFDLRVRMIRELAAKANPDGIVAVSLWRFMHDEGLAARARLSHEQAREHLALPELDENDFLIGWQGKEKQYRYCHHFSDEEIARIVSEVERPLPFEAGTESFPGGQEQNTRTKAPKLIEQFDADGRTGALNTYLVFAL